MAEGVRIRLIDERRPADQTDGYIVTIRDVSHKGEPDQFGNYPGCGVCQLPPPGHEGYKMKHLRLDNDGYAIVSVDYWNDMKRFPDNGGFEMANPVAEPPRQQLIVSANGDGSTDGKLIVHHKVMRPILTENLTKGKG